MKKWYDTVKTDSHILKTQYKIIPELSDAEVRKLDSVYRALKTLYSSSKADLLERLRQDDLVSADFKADYVKRHFEVLDFDLELSRDATEALKLEVHLCTHLTCITTFTLLDTYMNLSTIHTLHMTLSLVFFLMPTVQIYRDICITLT